MQVLEYHFILFPTAEILQNWYYFWLLQLLRMNYITCWCHWPCQDSEPHIDGEESVDHIRTLPMQFSTHKAAPYHYVVHWSEYICLPWASGSVLKMKQCWWKCNMLTCKLKLAKYNQGDRGSTVVKVLHYKSEGRWFDSRWHHGNFSLT